MTPSARVYSSTCRACSGVEMSPLAITGSGVAALTARMVSYSACPEKPQARVRPCSDSSRIPLSSAIFATRSAFLFPLSQPVRYLRVTGTSTASTTASRILPTSASSRSSAEPAMALHTFFAGQPMLMSMICAPCSTL